MTKKSPENSISILLCDDHRIVREGIRSSLAQYKFIRVVGEAADGEAALVKIRDLAPEIVLMDLNMPGLGGLATTRLINERFPQTKVIALTMHDNQEYVSEILRSGARGYVLKDTSPEELVNAIRSVAKGDAFFSPPISRILLLQYKGPEEKTGGEKLSPREREVLRHVANGDSNKEISSSLSIGIRTVETHRARVMQKLQARNAAELSRIALEQKLL